jgi:hypothetical protein
LRYFARHLKKIFAKPFPYKKKESFGPYVVRIRVLGRMWHFLPPSREFGFCFEAAEIRVKKDFLNYTVEDL